ncbi:MAG: hypothetical protein KDA31_05860 [Phycisphaerales bacterium]|nr:hypothetical protein [Phycisphaerales bacterium]MCB9835867.1 hypothetical protein [Phycisphaera sp.]
MRALIGALLLLLTLTSVQAQSTVYVDAFALGANDGTSWANAYRSLQAAIDALQPGDILRSRGTFAEAVDIRTEDIRWFGNDDPIRPTWIRGDRYSPNWTATATPGVYALAGVAGLIGTALKPGSIVYDYKRDDLQGSVTGVDLRRHMDELPANGAGVYFGHLKPLATVAEIQATSSSWCWDGANDAVYIHIPKGATFDPAKAGVCINGLNGVSVWAGDVRISGVNTICTPGVVNNSGYGLKGLGTFSGGVFENCDIVDPGWHAAGFEIGSPTNCTLRNIRAWSSGVDGSNANNPFVFFALGNVPSANHLGEDLTFHAYPLLGTDGSPIYTTFLPKLGLSHPTILAGSQLGGVHWRRCKLFSYESELEAKHGLGIFFGGNSVVATGTPSYDPDDPEDYPVVVEDSYFEGSSAVPTGNIRFERCIFAPGDSELSGEYRVVIEDGMWMRSCMFEIGRDSAAASSAFFKLENTARVHLDLCTIHAEHDDPVKHVFRTSYGAVLARQSVFSTRNPSTIMLIWPDAWDATATTHSFDHVYYAGPLTMAAHAWAAPRTQSWWQSTMDPDGVFAGAAAYEAPEMGNLRPVFGTALYEAKSDEPLSQLIDLLDIDGNAYSRSYGAYQTPCRGDVNHDGVVSPADFSAWVAAFNAQLPECDVNIDGICSPADFSAWVTAFNRGC